MFDPNVTFAYADDQRFTFPKDPARRLFTADELFKFAAVHLYKAGKVTDDGIRVDDILDTIQSSFNNGTIVPVLSLT